MVYTLDFALYFDEIIIYEFLNFILAGDSVQKWLQQVRTILNGSLTTERESLPSYTPCYTQQNMTRHKSTQSSPSFCHHRDHPRGDEPGPSMHNDSSILSLPLLQLCDARL